MSNLIAKLVSVQGSFVQAQEAVKAATKARNELAQAIGEAMGSCTLEKGSLPCFQEDVKIRKERKANESDPDVFYLYVPSEHEVVKAKLPAKKSKVGLAQLTQKFGDLTITNDGEVVETAAE